MYYPLGDPDLVIKAEDEWLSHQEEVSGDEEKISDNRETK